MCAFIRLSAGTVTHSLICIYYWIKIIFTEFVSIRACGGGREFASL